MARSRIDRTAPEHEVSFDISGADRALIDKIVVRAGAIAKKHGREFDRLCTTMDLVATHANGCPLDLARLADADDFNVAHDVFGIARFLDRDTGQLGGCFLPRFSA